MDMVAMNRCRCYSAIDRGGRVCLHCHVAHDGLLPLHRFTWPQWKILLIPKYQSHVEMIQQMLSTQKYDPTYDFAFLSLIGPARQTLWRAINNYNHGHDDWQANNNLSMRRRSDYFVNHLQMHLHQLTNFTMALMNDEQEYSLIVPTYDSSRTKSVNYLMYKHCTYYYFVCEMISRRQHTSLPAVQHFSLQGRRRQSFHKLANDVS